MFGLRSGKKKNVASDAGSTPNSGSSNSDLPDLSTPGALLTTKQRGQLGEDAAALFLEQRGFQIIARNWRPGNSLRGEIDAIAWTRDERGQKVLCFVEVKTRSSNLSSTLRENQLVLRETAAPQEAVTPSKQRQIARLANAYVSLNRLDNVACRFDVVEVRLMRGAAPACSLCVNAFDYRE